ncbi:MAG: C10 family peptidase [Bacteroidaceae bacterium]|nr:C10 family peptidase [Bacteroidaceae bacterium]
MRKRFIMLLIALLAVTLVHARQISEQEAQMKAEKFFGKQGQNHSNMRRAPRKAPKLILASNREELYIFNDKANGGYVVISGDDRMPDVLAYSYDGLYDDDNIPCNMKAWMDDYAGQVAYLKIHPEAEVKRQSATKRENINPLLTCRFGQVAPYNNKCPIVDGSRCVTGCVATAIAQIMYYYKWPKQTTKVLPGYITETHRISMPAQPITTIDWDNIRGEYQNNYSNDEADAVSTLMLLCGTAVEMNYDLSGSGTFEYLASVALKSYFDYNDMLDFASRDDYNLDIWEAIIYDELKENRPVYYRGSKDNGLGHAFVIDGYENGYYHVNWGWGGEYSYVLMTDVGGWNELQYAIVGIQPAYPDIPSRYAVLNNGKMTLFYDTEKEQRSGTMIFHKDDWSKYKNEITECVIDPSYANLRPRSLRCFFDGLSQLKSIEGVENLWTDNVTDMAGMFQDCSSLTSIDLSSFKTDKVTTMECMFNGCFSLTNLDLSGFNTDNVTDMGGMFQCCYSLASIDLSSFKTDKVTTMECMFTCCSSLTNLDLSGFKTDNVTNMGWMFYECRSLTNLDMRSFKTDKVTDMGAIFYGCRSLTNLDVRSFNTDKVTDMSWMFSGCSSLTSLDLSSFKTDNVTDMEGMFSGCQNLKTIYVREGWNTANVGNSDWMFSGCIKLVGGSGTTYDYSHTTAEYAHIDGGITNPGYLTYKDTHNTIIYMVDGEEYKSYRLEIGKDIIPEPKPTKDGYVFLGWDDIPATMPDHDVVVTGAFYPYGDVNTDKDVDVLDVVDIARYVVEIPSESFVKQLADINKDGNVNLGDAVTLVNEIAGEQNFVRAKASPKDIYTNDILSLTEWGGSLSLNLQNERYYTAFQFDLYVPDGTDVTQMSLNSKRKRGHQLLYNKVRNGHYRVAALSTSNNEFTGNDGELMIVSLNGIYDHEVSIRHIHFFDVKGNDYQFDDIEGSNTTSLNSLTPALSKGEGDDIYDLQGRKRLALQRGVNIVGGKKVVIK